jgi:hypothetical protein
MNPSDALGGVDHPIFANAMAGVEARLDVTVEGEARDRYLD